MPHELVTSTERPDLEPAAAAAFRERWPEFIFHDPIPPRYMARVDEYFPDFNVLLLDGSEVAAGGWGVPFAHDGRVDDLPGGYDDCLVRAVEDREASRSPTALAFMAAAVNPPYDKQGLAVEVLAGLTARACEAGMQSIFAPLRPTWKSRYPQVSMAEYATWTRDDGLSIDPWIRTHQRMGATIIGPAPDSMVISGSVADWEGWAGMVFPATGSYVVPDALNLVEVDLARDVAVYREENLWVQHR